MWKISPLKRFIIVSLVVVLWSVAIALLIIYDQQIKHNVLVLVGREQRQQSGLVLTKYKPAADVKVRYAKQQPKYAQAQILISSDQSLQYLDLPEGWKWYTSVDNLSYYVLETNKLADGVHEHAIFVKDESEISHVIDIRLDAKADRPVAPTWPGTDFYSNGDNILAIANKKYRLTMHYEPADLVKISDYKIKNFNDPKVRKVIIDDLVKMTKAIDKAGIDYKISSGYRSYETQVSVYNYWLKLQEGDQAKTDTFSARAGHSEHQLGTTIDFVTEESDDSFYLFDRTRLAKWLANNAHKYGFVISYPEGKQSITGYTFEPWHYRYVGRDQAKLVRASQQTLTEWLREQNSLTGK